MLCSLAFFALLATAHGRAVNISNTWVLPEEGFPVFYRYFRDRISWYEADAVCQFHHANLVTVDTTAQYDAVRAYLKELDISSAVWVGLIRSNPDGDFTWTDYRGLSGDGYWSSAPDSRSAPLCAAANPTADYRWEARACGGPTVASFICELPVPQWALGNEGCMVRALPALTILYLPESAAVQLTADCGLAGVKRVQCTGNVKREDLLKDLACVEEEESTSTTQNLSSTGWSATTDLTFTDQETTTDLTTQDVVTTDHEVDIDQPNLITTTAKQESLYRMSSNVVSNILMNKDIDLSDNNAQSNFIPKINDVENILTDDQLEKLEDERHMQHKMLHEEIARVGNVENIFTQPTDHFIPPLVMAKAKISDDMTVLSLAEKHAQQLAERQFSKHYGDNDHDHTENHSEFSKPHSEINSDKPLITSIKIEKLKDVKKDYKTNIPKKYINDKFYDAKTKISKDARTTEKDRTMETMTSTETTSKNVDTTATATTEKIQFVNDQPDEDNNNMDLTIILKDSSHENDNLTLTNYTGDIVKLDSVLNNTNTSEIPLVSDTNNTETRHADNKTSDDVTLDHEVIKITIISDDDPLATHKVFEVTTKVPIFKDDAIDNNFSKSITFLPSPQTEQTHVTEHVHFVEETTTTKNADVKIENETIAAETIPTTPNTITPVNVHTSLSTIQAISTHSDIISTVQHTTATPENINLIHNTTKSNITHETETQNHTDAAYSTEQTEIKLTEEQEARNETNSESDDDFQSPLLSAANEPLHRPPRTRRPQQQNRNKFNPFRILG